MIPLLLLAAGLAANTYGQQRSANAQAQAAAQEQAAQNAYREQARQLLMGRAGQLAPGAQDAQGIADFTPAVGHATDLAQALSTGAAGGRAGGINGAQVSMLNGLTRQDLANRGNGLATLQGMKQAQVDRQKTWNDLQSQYLGVEDAAQREGSLFPMKLNVASTAGKAGTDLGSLLMLAGQGAGAYGAWSNPAPNPYAAPRGGGYLQGGAI